MFWKVKAGVEAILGAAECEREVNGILWVSSSLQKKAGDDERDRGTGWRGESVRVFVPDTSQLPWERAGAEGPISQVRIPGEGRKGAHGGRWPGWKVNCLPGRVGTSRCRGQEVGAPPCPVSPAPIRSTPLTLSLLSLGRQAVFPLTMTHVWSQALAPTQHEREAAAEQVGSLVTVTS